MSENGTKPKVRAPLVAPRFSSAEQVRNCYRAVLEQGTTVDDIKDPSFWSYIAVLLRPFDKIEVLEESGAFYAELLVTSCDRTWAVVTVLTHKALQAPDVAVDAVPPEVEVRWRGPHHKFCAVRIKDSAVLKAGMQTKEEAQSYVSEYVRTVS